MKKANSTLSVVNENASRTLFGVGVGCGREVYAATLWREYLGVTPYQDHLNRKIAWWLIICSDVTDF